MSSLASSLTDSELSETSGLPIPPPTIPVGTPPEETDHPLIFFLNPGSGAGLAAALMAKLEGQQGISFVRLPNEAQTWTTTHADVLNHRYLRLVACGGDGTNNWVVSLCNAHFGTGDIENRPPIAVIPFGTGNDMSRALGWGRGMTLFDIDRIFERILAIRNSGNVQSIDVWNVVVNEEGKPPVSSQMLNYCSLGVDAETALDFEHCRKGKCKCCFCCHCMAIACYFPVGVGNMCCKRSLGSYTTVTIDGQRIQTQSKDKTVIIQAIPSMYAGLNPWQCTAPTRMDDRKFEVTLQGGAVSLGLFQIGCNTGRPKCQGSRAEIRTTEPAYLQVDGEGQFINGAATITIERVGSYPMVFSQEQFD
jgi:diacylglycerol kinase (ATP)